MNINKLHLIVLILASVLVGLFAGIFITPTPQNNTAQINQEAQENEKEIYWFELHRKSGKEFLYRGVPNDTKSSKLVREFTVKSGVPGQKPTPLPELLGREYWNVIGKMDSSYDPETSPYFLTLDVPITDQEPYGPANYRECNGQCNWELPGYFGLHGVGGDMTKLSAENEGSSGCIRHTDDDITYLYNLLDPTKEEIRYYIKDI